MCVGGTGSGWRERGGGQDEVEQEIAKENNTFRGEGGRGCPLWVSGNSVRPWSFPGKSR